MKLLDILTHAADEEQLQLKPLPKHALATRDEHLRQHYALLLAAVLTAQPAVSEAQTRLLRLLLDSLKLGDIRGQLFDQARALEPEPLLEAARLIREAGAAEHLLVDVLVLLRLDGPLRDEAARMAAELAAFLNLSEEALATRAADAADILGLSPATAAASPTPKPKPEEATGPHDAVPKKHEGLSLADMWPGRIPQRLTPEALRAGLQGGLWLLDADLRVDFPWQAEGAVVLFLRGAKLITTAQNGEIGLTDCRLHQAQIQVQGACPVEIEGCTWLGHYDPAWQATALFTQGGSLSVTGSAFHTANARAIQSTVTKLVVNDCRFEHCGHPNLRGGAVCHRASEDFYRSIQGCHFLHCQGSHGGALYVDTLLGIKQCVFVRCTSVALQAQSAGDIAVFAGRAKGNPAVANCIFDHTSLNIGAAYWGNNVTFVRSCQFVAANVYLLLPQ